MLFPAFGNHFSSLDSFLIKIGAGNYLVKQARTPPVRTADGAASGLSVYESFVPVEACRGLGLRAKIKSAEHAPAL